MADRDVIERYYRGFRDRDVEAVRATLTAEFHFTSPFGEFRGRDMMLDSIWPSVGQSWATNLSIFGEGPEYVVIYEHETAPGAQRPPMRMAEYLRFDGDLIASIEVFVGRTLA